ncbi:nucleotide exchange factor GrpE [Luminiphilus syltensis]|nr:nucleotide exchange factor GrpE [Luminiphilus syltensis]
MAEEKTESVQPTDPPEEVLETGEAAAESDNPTNEPDAISGESAPDATIERLEAELATAREDALRAQADSINARRRAEQEVEKARKFALERFIGELLPVVDNLERALQAAGGDDQNRAVVEGIELTLKSFTDALSKSGVEALNPEGEPYDPQTAQAMSMVENADMEPNTVVAVMQKGYQLNGRLLRPAMVMVSKAAS